MAAPTFLHCLLAIWLLSCAAHAQLSTTFYSASCPSLEAIVRTGMNKAVRNERRIGASLLRLFFHDCFVQGCDGSVLLDAGGEKQAAPNNGSIRGFGVVDAIKAGVEAACPGVVSCADILALTARDGTFLLGGPTWRVPLGRRDSTTASRALANANLPPPTADLSTLISLFLGRAHHRPGPVPKLQRPNLQRRQHRPVLRGAAAIDVPELRQQEPGAHRRADPRGVRRRLLPEPAGEARPVPLRPGALQRRVAGRAGAAVQRQPRALPERLRQGDDQDGQHTSAHRQRRRDQGQLPCRQQLAHRSVDDWLICILL